MKRMASLVLFGLVVLSGHRFGPAHAQTAPPPQTYSVTVVNALLGPPITVKISRDGNKELVDRNMPATMPGQTPSHTMQLYDFQSGTAFIWDVLDSKVPCGKSTTTDKAVDYMTDPISGVTEWMKEIDPAKSKPAGTAIVNGIATKAMEATDPASKMSAKVWLADKGNYLIKYEMTAPGAAPRVMFEIKTLSFDKPPASVFALPAACNGIPVTGSFSTGPTSAAPPPPKTGAKVTGVTVQMPAKYTGACAAPAHARVTGTITTDGPGTVWYRFELGALGYQQGQEGTLVFARAGTMTVTRDVTFEFFASIGFGGGSGYLGAAMQDPSGQHGATVNSKNADYSVECATGESGAAAAPPTAASAALTATPIRINAGGPAQTGADGIRWEADKGFSAGEMFANTKAPITGTRAPSIYQTNRWNRGDFEYAFNVSNGHYLVTLKFAEIYFTNPGQRVFGVSINGQVVLTRFDTLVAAGGPNKAVDKQFPVEVTNGRLVIHFTKGVENPQVSALEIVKVER